MIPNSDAPTAAAAAVQPTSGSTGTPQRQSCDRCHKQKLRCIRNKSNGDVCDRCFAKRATCVYSSSLPKGRPSLRRLTVEGTNNGNTAAAEDTSKTQEVTRPLPKSRPASTETTAPTILPQLMDTSIDMSMCTWPWMGTTSWEETQPDMSWDGLNFSRADADDLLATFEGDGSAREELDAFSSTTSPSTPSPPHIRNYNFGQPGIGNYERQNGGTGNNMESGMGGNTMSMFPDKGASVVIGQLSQLSVHLSSLRSASHTLAQAADSSFGRGPNEGHFPLIDSAAFESVTAWLAHEQSSANLNPRQSIHVPTDIPNPWPNPGNLTKPRSGPNILRDVFASSHRLMEILRHLQADDITRHLVMACEALLLEIYLAILTVLQHEAYPGESMNATALGNVRLVLVVQLCAYLIERQHQAVGQCLAPAAAQKHNVPSSLPAGSSHLGTADRESLKDLKVQVQQKLTRLRQMLRCT
ncbi:hypothetical protein K458DRAFT_435701 [Lentithecium fluviatile CBS 122367]|uniref:Zn(2)-C6 fungal-type domain-containing protein n=1 Tax=Lentithecium fluviatile CBS 122367 TaxID=1168545 RepID=A0A6G1IKE3_9PLEO|nr:hypothetical protein K458DRAFT_435701 [Lentithecium fluviatile CBS 122367]